MKRLVTRIRALDDQYTDLWRGTTVQSGEQLSGLYLAGEALVIEMHWLKVAVDQAQRRLLELLSKLRSDIEAFSLGQNDSLVLLLAGVVKEIEGLLHDPVGFEWPVIHERFAEADRVLSSESSPGDNYVGRVQEIRSGVMDELKRHYANRGQADAFSSLCE